MSNVTFHDYFQEKQPHNKFKFKCVKGCDLCCRHQVALYPFDIMALCNELNIESAEFHAKFTYFEFDEDACLLRCYLHTTPRCIFFDDKYACSVYGSRPVRCRLFPAARMWNPDGSVQYYLPKDKCPGFEHGPKHTVDEWMSQDDIQIRESLVVEWQKFINDLKNDESIPRGDKFFIVFFKKIFYDYDNRFQKLVVMEKGEPDKEDYASRMERQYKLSKIFLENIEEWKKGYEEFSKEDQADKV